MRRSRLQESFLARVCAGAILLPQISGAALSAAEVAGQTYEGYEMVDVDSLPLTRAPTAIGVVAAFLPSIEDPLPTELLSLTISGTAEALIVEARARGYADDAIAGENYKALVVPDGSSWRLEALGRQLVCARGPQNWEPGLLCQ